MTRLFNTLLTALLGAASISNAQVAPCATDEQYRLVVNKHPEIAALEQQLESQLAMTIGHKTTASFDTTIYDVPLVIHVIHDYGFENITDNDLYTAAAYWADVYMKRNADTADVITPFIPWVGNPRIRLHLATIDPNGKPSKGIVRVASYLANAADDQAKYTQWPQNKYVNIWLVGRFGATVGTGVLAYAIPPAAVMYEPFYDGVICLSSSTGSASKTIPHEIGHVFNLQHTWGNTNNPAVACGDDHVDDTPPTMGHWNYGCIPATLYDTACASGYQKFYLSSDGTVDSLADYPDTANSQNIMDYTDCARMFTKGQSYRMRTALNSATASRNNLITPANLAATGALQAMPDLPPVADFIMNHTDYGPSNALDKRSYFLTMNNPGNFIFKNASWNDTITSVEWTFSNGASTPTSASTGYVSNKFSQPGWVTVSLIASSNAGHDTLVNTHAVYVADTAAAGTLSYTQDFSESSAIANWPMFNYYNNQFKWEYFNGAGVGDNSCIRYRSYDTSNRIFGTATGDHDDLYTPAFTLAGATGTVYFNFFSAGAYTDNNIGTRDPHIQDSLEIDASTNGGGLWTKIAGFHTADLENNGSQGAEFIPTSPSQWVARSVPVPAADFTANTFFRFRFWPGNQGNNLYIDKFSLSPFPAGVKEALDKSGVFNIYPNPTSGDFTLVVNTGSTGKVNYRISDVAGKTIYDQAAEFAPATVGEVRIKNNFAPGLYFVTTTINGLNTTQKLIVY
jgi:hypothetical protein